MVNKDFQTAWNDFIKVLGKELYLDKICSWLEAKLRNYIFKI
jgi:hypothetical protein